jgi:hypothetical protein
MRPAGSDFCGLFTQVFANMGLPIQAYLELSNSSRKEINATSTRV